MSKIKSIWTSITGSVSSGAPLLFACCKSGACVGVCASPVASLFGVSAAGFASSPWMDAAVPLLIALSAVSFTASYYKLYVLPKFAPACDTDCGCDTAKPSMNTKVSKAIFWTGLVASIGFFSFFEYQKFQANNLSAAASSCSTSASGKCTTETATAFASFGSNEKVPCCSEEKSVPVKEVKVAGVNNKIIMPVDEAAEVTTTEKPCCSTSTPDCVKQK